MKFLISGGGTGGHIFPAVAIADEIRRRRPDAEILFVGALGRMEMERVPAAGYKIEGLPVAGLDRRRPWRNFGVLWKLWKSLRRARQIVKEFAPDAAIGVGGYASAPVLWAAQRRGIPTLIQEQNSYAGVANKILGKRARAICVAYDGMERFFPAESIVTTGNPLRPALAECTLSRIEAKKELGFNASRPLVVALGGSLGARTINEAIAASLPVLEQHRASLLWQTGKLYIDRCAPLAEGHQEYRATPFVDNMGAVYRAADLIVARAGAGTISEIELMGCPSILIPSPNVAEDHQRHNAEALSRRQAAVMILDADATALLPQTISTLLDKPECLVLLGKNAAAMALPGAAAKIVDRLFQIIQK
ncbi:MAG: undecaprenyldiphospho-muramoylpentapeptide beta-N-acetylglucosaminyltransferase [Pseudoflavonifractor sp.]|nr:undecaprenyldiphospho-muramoylpentapeptide beta-N-acetylglucosaminyltransferase [Alloprevotella sp.]MCM1117427.1 undecaprenyldiphospho-muramoylpentapeptide beta-N-acetylglucosaminyltransferase [Pseudoflavonifractor sp.]